MRASYIIPLKTLNFTTMKTIINSLIFCALTVIINLSAIAQSAPEGSEVIGRWDLTVVIEDKDMQELGLFRHGLMDTKGFPGWLEIKLSGFSTLVGYYVGYECSARPISEIHYSKEYKKYHFTIPPQWMDIDDLYFEFTLKDDKLTGYEILDGHKLQWTGVRAPDLTRKEPPVWGVPKNLLDDNMSKWIIPANNKWRMIDGVLKNADSGGNLGTMEKFIDF
jgi:hypothetical protein